MPPERLVQAATLRLRSQLLCFNAQKAEADASANANNALARQSASDFLQRPLYDDIVRGSHLDIAMLSGRMLDARAFPHRALLWVGPDVEQHVQADSFLPADATSEERRTAFERVRGNVRFINDDAADAMRRPSVYAILVYEVCTAVCDGWQRAVCCILVSCIVFTG